MIIKEKHYLRPDSYLKLILLNTFFLIAFFITYIFLNIYLYGHFDIITIFILIIIYIFIIPLYFALLFMFNIVITKNELIIDRNNKLFSWIGNGEKINWLMVENIFLRESEIELKLRNEDEIIKIDVNPTEFKSIIESNFAEYKSKLKI